MNYSMCYFKMRQLAWQLGALRSRPDPFQQPLFTGAAIFNPNTAFMRKFTCGLGEEQTLARLGKVDASAFQRMNDSVVIGSGIAAEQR